jgi:hypothetical protein
MENIVFTQLSIQEVRAMLRDEFRQALREFTQLPVKDEDAGLLNIQEVAQVLNISDPSIYGHVEDDK